LVKTMWSFLIATVVSATNTTPVEKVITLLTDLEAQKQAELTEETELFNKFISFCDSKTTEKQDSIAGLEQDESTAEANIVSENANIGTAVAEVAKHTATKEGKSAELTASVQTCQADQATFEKNDADLDKAVSSLGDAIEHIKSSQDDSLLSETVKTTIRHNVALAHSLGVAKSTSLLSGPGDKEYGFHSTDIITTLEDLETEFKDKLTTLREENSKRSKQCEDDQGALRDEITAEKDTVISENAKKATAQIALGEAKTNLENAKIDLSNDRTYLKDVTARCDTKKTEWKQREEGRTNEIAALQQALQVMQDKVSGKEAGRALVQEPNRVTKQVNVAEIALPSFIQVGKQFLSPVAPHDKAKELLTTQGKALKSTKLLTMAQQLGGPFDKVKGLIQQLIERLMSEAAKEATHQGFCETERAKAELKRKHRHADVSTGRSELLKLGAQRDKLEVKVEDLNAAIESLTTELGDAQTLRNEEKDSNTKAVADAKDGLTAVNEAIAILKKYYKGEHGVGGADTATVLVDASPVEEEGEWKEIEGRGGAYQGGQGSATNIFGLLEVIKSDFSREINTVSDEERQAQADYVTFKRDTSADKAGKETEFKNSTDLLESTKNQIKIKLSDLQNAMKLQGDEIKILDDMWDRCVAVDMTFEERQEKIKAEIDALINACHMLSPEGDGQAAGCPAKGA